MVKNMKWYILINGKKIGNLTKYDGNEKEIKDYICNKYTPFGVSLKNHITPNDIEILDENEYRNRKKER